MSTLHIDQIEPFYEPRTKILPQLPYIAQEPEMTEFESAFLCGLLKKYKPHKIVEVGIAGGGTTAIILQCMDLLGIADFEMHSIDYSERFYRNSNFQSGYLGIKAKNILEINHKINHHFHLGNIACSFMTEIGGNIDFLIIDTMHILPGEILDFITLLPWLKTNAVVVLHDISLNQYSLKSDCIATGTLFSLSVGDKYINYDDLHKKQYPNIGAFLICADTHKYVSDLFLSLFMTWSYVPDKRQLNGYKSAIKSYYSEELVELFDLSILANKERINKINFIDRIRQAARIILKR